jgi:hypothetical protein
MRNLPRNDEEYDALLGRIVKGAEYLENPLIKPADYKKGMALYDELCNIADKYRFGGRA